MKCLYYLENDQKIIVSIYLRNFYLISYVIQSGKDADLPGLS